MGKVVVGRGRGATDGRCGVWVGGLPLPGVGNQEGLQLPGRERGVSRDSTTDRNIFVHCSTCDIRLRVFPSHL